MKRANARKRIAAILGITVLASVPTYAVTASPASAHHIIDQGCVHYNEGKGPALAWTVDAFLRCKGSPVWRKPDIIGGPDGACKKMIPHHRVEWIGIGHTQVLPWQHVVRSMKPCGPSSA